MMKPKIHCAQHCFAFLLIALFSATIYGQDLSVGLQAGVNMSGVQTLPRWAPSFVYDAQMIPGGQFNLIFEHQFGIHPISISNEPGVVVKGYSGYYYGGNRSKFRLTYLNLPTVLNYYPTKRIGVSIGAELNYLIRSSIDGQKDSFVHGLYEKVEIGGIAGLNYRILKKCTLGVRYSRGLTPLLKYIFTGDFGASLGPAKMLNFSTQAYLRYTM